MIRRTWRSGPENALFHAL